MKLEINKRGLAILHATTKEESDRLMLYYLGKTPATQKVVEEEEPKRVYTHSKKFMAKRRGKLAYSKVDPKQCEYGCGSFKNLTAHMLQKHGIGKNGLPQAPTIGGKRHLTHGTQQTRREYLTLPELPDFRGR